MKRMKRTEEGKPYLLKDALDPRAHNAHAKGPSNALELEGDGRGTDARKEEKARRKKRRKLYKSLWDWARVVSFVYIFMVATITLCNGLPPSLFNMSRLFPSLRAAQSSSETFFPISPDDFESYTTLSVSVMMQRCSLCSAIPAPTSEASAATDFMGAYFFIISSPRSVYISSGSFTSHLKIFLISLGTTTLPSASILLTIPVFSSFIIPPL